MQVQTNPSNIIEMAVERGLKIAYSTDNSELTEDELVTHCTSCVRQSLDLVISFVDDESDELDYDE